MIELRTAGDARRGKVRYALDGARVIVEAERGARVELPLADVAQVRLAHLGAVGLCELTARDGRKVMISTGLVSGTQADAQTINGYNELVRALHAALVERAPDARYVIGAWTIVWLIAVVMLLIGGVALWSAATAPRAGLFAVAGVAALAVIPVVAVYYRPRRYDPREIPATALPG